MDMRVGLYPLTGEPGCGSGGTGTALKSGNSGSRLQAVYNQGHASVVVLLLADERLDPNITNQDGDTALILAADEGQGSVVTLLLADDRVDPTITNQKGSTALIFAACEGHDSAVVVLLAGERLDTNIANRMAPGHSSVPLSMATPRW